jgi:hypothetical protein
LRGNVNEVDKGELNLLNGKNVGGKEAEPTGYFENKNFEEK